MMQCSSARCIVKVGTEVKYLLDFMFPTFALSLFVSVRLMCLHLKKIYRYECNHALEAIHVRHELLYNGGCAYLNSVKLNHSSWTSLACLSPAGLNSNIVIST